MKIYSHIIIRSIMMSMVIACFSSSIANAEITDSHSFESIINAIKMPIPDAMVKQARDADDQLMRSGQDQNGNKLYLVTDERSVRVNLLTTKLLNAMGENANAWVVRVLDTDPKIQNAFVMGGKYIYVFTGLIDDAGEDELAFVLSHEIGHSVLKHYLRKKDDTVNSTLSGMAVVVAALSKKNRDAANIFGKEIGASYSRIDEEEADAFGVATAKRAGYNPIHGADFFIRMQRKSDQIMAANLNHAKTDMDNAKNVCAQWQQKYNAALIRTQQLVNNYNATCQDANNKILRYNQLLTQKSQPDPLQYLSSHPSNQNRIATIAALVDYLDGRRDIDSLSKFVQSYRVMQALKQVNYVVVQPMGSNDTRTMEPAPAITVRDLVGKWVGAYVCGQTSINAELQVDENLTALFRVFSAKSQYGAFDGSYKGKMEINGSSISFRPSSRNYEVWTIAPSDGGSTWLTSEFNGTLNTNKKSIDGV